MDRRKQYNLWFYAARVLPMSAMLIALIFYFLEFNSLLEYVFCAILVSFSLVAVYWWWWVMITTNNLFDVMEETNETFKEITREVKEIKSEINADNR